MSDEFSLPLYAHRLNAVRRSRFIDLSNLSDERKITLKTLYFDQFFAHIQRLSLPNSVEVTVW
tara:strand:+ start:23436 stop:23624 length:189 start_codon:yes stop_codon:yes gene_type:complete